MDAASGGHLPAAGFTGVATYEDWLAQDCDCTPERPCPMFCDGITVVDEDSIIAPQTLEAQPMCEFEIDPNAACPPFLQYDCGVVHYFDRFPPPNGPFSVEPYEYRRQFEPGTYRLLGWALYVNNPMEWMVCGGVLVDAPFGCEDQVLCALDANATTCECPPSP